MQFSKLKIRFCRVNVVNITMINELSYTQYDPDFIAIKSLYHEKCLHIIL